MGKRDITMTSEEVDEFLAACPAMAVGAIGEDGWPLGTIAAPTFADGALRLSFAAGDPVRARLQQAPAVCATADAGRSYYEIKGVTVVGSLTADDTVVVDRVVSFDFGRLRQR